MAARQLEFPEYSGKFINYKALKKLMNSLLVSSSDENQEHLLKERKGSFFFRLERELEKVNLFYLEKESELRIRLDILIEKKLRALAQGRLNNNKNSVAYISLYEGFMKFSKDLKRLEQFVELNEIGFTKVLKKWDKRSKSHTKELYLTTAVNVQPVFHRDEIVELSDLVANHLLELEAKAEGESIVRYAKSKADEVIEDSVIPKGDITEKEADELYTDFVSIASSQPVQGTQEDLLHSWCDKIKKISTDIDFSKIFLLLIANFKISDKTIKIFYDSFQELIDLSTTDDLNGRNCLHEASLCPATERLFVIRLALDAGLSCSARDISGKTPLHYATEVGREDIVRALLPNLSQELIDIPDNESMTPLLQAIANQNVICVKLLLEKGANPLPPQDPNSPSYLPLNVACKFGNLEIVKLILERAKDTKQEVFLPNAEGLLPLHIVANFGHYQLVPLLIEFGAKVNQLDKLNKWSPIFYSAIEGYKKTTQKLIEFGADFKIKDEDGLTPLYYAAWEGNIGVLNAFIEILGKEVNQFEHLAIQKPITKTNNDILSPLLAKSTAMVPDFPSLDLIPDLSLPPPILPLRKYGHNFLEKRMFVKLNFYTNRDSIKVYDNLSLSSTPGRITVNCAQNDIIPRSLLLPVSDEDKTATFQVDSLENFSIDFEIFPTFGTRLIGKTTLLSSTFANSTSRSCYKSSNMNNNINLVGDLVIPLYDIRMRIMGELRFNYQIIYPYSGIPLEITQYDTYWKSTNNNSLNGAAKKSSYFSFVTASSLSGEYYRVFVCNLNDGTPVICPNWRIEVAGLQIPLGNLNLEQLQKLAPQDEQIKFLNQLNSKDHKPHRIERILKNLYLPLDVFLNALPLEISLDIEIFYPTLYEENFSNLQISEEAIGFTNVLNNYIDSILTAVFDHVRSIRRNIKNKTRSLIFSSPNSTVCTILNWKQPNYPVFYIMNGMSFDSIDKKFSSVSANGFLISNDIINEIKKKQLRTQLKTSVMLHNNQMELAEDHHQMNIDNIDSINKNSSSYNNELLYQDLLTRSVKLGVNFVTQNNLLGLIVSSKMLKLCPGLIKTIRSRGLILVASKDEIIDENCDNDQAMTSFDSDGHDEEFIHSIIEYYNNSDDDNDVNGLRFNDILSFKDAIDM